MKNKSSKFTLAQYAALASGTLLTGDVAFGQVVYTDVEPDIVLDVTGGDTDFDGYQMNLDDDFFIDFVFRLYADPDSGYGLGVYRAQVSPYFNNTGGALVGQVYSGPWSVYGMVSMMDEGATIGPDNDFVGFSNISYYLYFANAFIGRNPAFPDQPNLWNDPDVPHYIGVRNWDFGPNYYGWIRVSVNEDFSQLTIYDYAVEQTAEAPIIAGAGLPVTCLAPAPITTGDITPTSATAKWSAVPDALGYTFRYRAIDGDWLTADIAAPKTFRKMKGLDCNSDYEWQVRAQCADGSYSEYSASSVFTTLECKLMDVAAAHVVYNYGNTIFVTLAENPNEATYLEIIDNTGKHCGTYQLNDITNTLSTQLAAGLYHIVISNDAGRFTQSLVITE